MTIGEYKELFPNAELSGLDWIKNNSNGQMGHAAWNKGITKEEDSRLSNCGKSDVVKLEKEYILTDCKHLFGTHFSEEHKQKIGLSNVGRIVTDDTKEKISQSNVGKHNENGMFGKNHSEDSKLQTSESVKKYINELPEELQKERVTKWFRASGLGPNKSELILQSILDKHFPNQWQYVGKGDFVLGGKIPDFLNINGKKQLIEFFGSFFHKPEEVKIRTDFFKSFGFSTLVIWDYELLDEKTIVERVKSLI